MDETGFCCMFAPSNLKMQSKKGFDLTIESLLSFSVQQRCSAGGISYLDVRLTCAAV